jgi:hypothetical protein
MQQNVSSMVRLGVIQSLYLRSTFGVGDRTRLRKRTTEETQTLAPMRGFVNKFEQTKKLHLDKKFTSDNTRNRQPFCFDWIFNCKSQQSKDKAILRTKWECSISGHKIL